MGTISDKTKEARRHYAQVLLTKWEAAKKMGMTNLEICKAVGVGHTYFYAVSRCKSVMSGSFERLDPKLEKLLGKKDKTSSDDLDKAISAPPKKKIRVVSSTMTIQQFKTIHQNLVKAAQDLTEARERYERLRNQVLTAEI